MRLAPLFLSAVAALAAEAPAASTWIVDRDGGPGVDFTSLSVAVDFVADGDILRVRESPLPYFPLTVSGKSLTILADPETAGARPVVPTVLVRDLAAGQTVVVSGFSVETPALFLQPAVWVRECAGAVFLEDLVVSPGSALFAALMEVANSPRVIVNRVELISPPASASGSALPGVPGLSVVSSSVALYDCLVEGADGASAVVSPFSGTLSSAQDGASGVVLSSGALLLAGCVVDGGDGGDGLFAFDACQPPGNGGDGVRVQSGTLTRLDSVATAGAAGAPAAGCPPSGVAGVDVRILGGNVSTIADTLRRFEVDGPIPEGTSASNVIEGVPGELVVLLVSFAPDGSIFPGLGGALAGAPPFLALSLGTVPPGGTLAFQVPVAAGSLPPSIDGIALFEQVLVAGAQGFGLLGSPAVVTIVR